MDYPIYMTNYNKAKDYDNQYLKNVYYCNQKLYQVLCTFWKKIFFAQIKDLALWISYFVRKNLKQKTIIKYLVKL